MAKKRNENQTTMNLDELRDSEITTTIDNLIDNTEETENYESEEKKIEVNVSNIDPEIILALAEYLKNPTDLSHYRFSSKMEEWAKSTENDIVVTTENSIDRKKKGAADTAIRNISENLFDNVKDHIIGYMSNYPEVGYVMDTIVHTKSIEKAEPRIKVHLNYGVYYIWKEEGCVYIMNSDDNLTEYDNATIGEVKYLFQKILRFNGSDIPFILRHKDAAMKMNENLNKDIIKILDYAWRKWGKSFITKM